MQKLYFPKPFVHKHEPIRSVNEIFDERLTIGQQTADAIARIVGSWWFIITQSIILLLWAALNVVGWMRHWDPYPFILMNLFLSLQAAYTAPVIMMSQNRSAARDRIEAHNDFLINQKAEEEIRAVLEHLTAQNEALLNLYEIVSQLNTQTGSRGTQPDL